MSRGRAAAMAYANEWLEARLRLGDEVWTRPRPNEAFRVGQPCWTVHVGDTMFGAVMEGTGADVGTFDLHRFGDARHSVDWLIASTEPRVRMLTDWLMNTVLGLRWDSGRFIPLVRKDVLTPFQVPVAQPKGRPLSPGRVRVDELGAAAARALVSDCGGAAVVARALGIGESTVRHWLRGTRALPRRHVEALVDLSCGAR